MLHSTPPHMHITKQLMKILKSKLFAKKTCHMNRFEPKILRSVDVERKNQLNIHQ
jgi:hypothetical protein